MKKILLLSALLLLMVILFFLIETVINYIGNERNNQYDPDVEECWECMMEDGYNS